MLYAQRPAHAAAPGERPNAHRLHRTRSDGREHGSPPAPRRTRDRRLQPDAREDARDRGRGRDRGLLDRRARRQAREAPRRLGHGPGGRRHRGADRGAARAPRARRHDHRRRQHELPRRRPATRGARQEGHQLRRRGDVGRDLGAPGGLLPDGRRRRRRGRPARAGVHDPRARGRLHARGRPGRGPLREDGPQRDRVRPDAGVRRRLRDPARLATTSSTSAAIADLWSHGSVVRSWLLELLARAFAREGQDLAHQGLGRRLRRGPLDGAGGDRPRRPGAHHHALAPDPLPLPPGRLLRAKVLAALRNEFGGHAVKTE